MKKDSKALFVIKTAAVLTIIASSAALLIGAADMLTKNRIEANSINKEKRVLQEYFGIPEGEGIEIKNNANLKKYYVVRLSNNELCYVYRAEGRNGFGDMSLLAGIKENGVFYNLHVLENGQSYANVLKENYLDPIEEAEDKDEKLNDVYCGASSGAKLVLKLVNAAKEHFEKEIKGAKQ